MGLLVNRRGSVGEWRLGWPVFLLGRVDDGINNQTEATWEVGLGEDSHSEIISGDFHVSLLYSGGEVYQAVQCLGLAFRRVVWAGHMCLECPASPSPLWKSPAPGRGNTGKYSSTFTCIVAEEGPAVLQPGCYCGGSGGCCGPPGPPQDWGTPCWLLTVLSQGPLPESPPLPCPRFPAFVGSLHPMMGWQGKVYQGPDLWLQEGRTPKGHPSSREPHSISWVLHSKRLAVQLLPQTSLASLTLYRCSSQE